jgi:15-cis-phytoene desaturase
VDRADVVVVGSGLAGLTAAYRLAKAGRRVAVLEAGAVLGGRTSSWVDGGMPVESGLHKFLGIYRALPALLREVGADPRRLVAWVDEVHLHVPEVALPARLFADPDDPAPLRSTLGGMEARAEGTDRHGRFGAAPYHRPVRTLLGLLGNNRLMPPLTKLRLARMMVRGLIDCHRRPLELDRRDIASYARSFGLSARAVHDVLHTLTTGVLFMPADQFSAYAVFAPVLEGLKGGMTFRVGAFTGGMTDVMIRPLAGAVERLGGTVRTNARVTRLAAEGGRVVGVEAGGEVVRADAVVLAVPLRPAQELVAAALPGHPWFRPMLSLETLSAVAVQMELDGPALPSDATHFAATGVCCFAEQCRTTFPHAPGRLSAILYPPDEFLRMEDAAVLERAVTDLGRAGVELAGRVRAYRVVRHPHDFYALRPGSEALRPTQATPVPGLALAGDYTKQPWVASMEGAAVSGERAAGRTRRDRRAWWGGYTPAPSSSRSGDAGLANTAASSTAAAVAATAPTTICPTSRSRSCFHRAPHPRSANTFGTRPPARSRTSPSASPTRSASMSGSQCP